MEGTATDISTSARSYFETFPRELRDLIYDQLYQEVNEIVSGLGSFQGFAWSAVNSKPSMMNAS
jgi:hypothetical protein